MNNIKLPLNFDGKGEVKGFTFKMVKETDFGYIYESDSGERLHYEVFKKVLTPVCVDFEKRIYSETEFKEVYPNSKAFGITAFTVPRLEKAEEILETFNKKEDESKSN